MSNHRTWSEIVSADPEHSRRYAQRWEGFVAQGRDIDGEARLIDAMVPRGARILDAGCGQGRLGGYLAGRGHDVLGVDIDPYLISVARETQPGGTWLVGDLANLAAVLGNGRGEGDEGSGGEGSGGEGPAAFDAVVAAGNVLTFIDPADRGDVLAGIRDALAADGRAVLGFGAGRGWSFDDFESDAFEAGLRITHRFATWNLHPFDAASDFLVVFAERA